MQIINKMLPMGPYGMYVWTAYGLVFSVLTGLSLWPSIQKHRLKKAYHASSS